MHAPFIHTYRDIHDALGGTVPIGLISSNWGGTQVQQWQPLESMVDCNPKVHWAYCTHWA
jgi:hypothetical protein